MNKNNLKLLGLKEDATKEEIILAYQALKEKYLEERFLDGEAGNNAAKMLTKIETAYAELMSEINQSESSADASGGDDFAKVEEYLKAGNIVDAQHVLDGFNERGAQWHYLQSVVFYKKQWMNESRKQLEIAMQLDAENEKYKEAYKKLLEKIKFDESNGHAYSKSGNTQNESVYQGQDMSYVGDDQMGGNACAQCIQCCYLNMCINCLCNSCTTCCR